ncbi:MAG: hypothetical protein AAGC44_03620 [Planctomycetota bacterium]
MDQDIRDQLNREAAEEYWGKPLSYGSNHLENNEPNTRSYRGGGGGEYSIFPGVLFVWLGVFILCALIPIDSLWFTIPLAVLVTAIAYGFHLHYRKNQSRRELLTRTILFLLGTWFFFAMLLNVVIYIADQYRRGML